MKKYLSLVLLCSAALYAADTATLTPELAKRWFDYKSRKMALAGQEFNAIASMINDEDLKESYEEVAEEFEELAEQFAKLEVPTEGLQISTKNKARWEALMQEGQELMKEKHAQIEQASKPQTDEDNEVVVLVMKDPSCPE